MDRAVPKLPNTTDVVPPNKTKLIKIAVAVVALAVALYLANKYFSKRKAKLPTPPPSFGMPPPFATAMPPGPPPGHFIPQHIPIQIPHVHPTTQPPRTMSSEQDHRPKLNEKDKESSLPPPDAEVENKKT